MLDLTKGYEQQKRLGTPDPEVVVRTTQFFDFSIVVVCFFAILFTAEVRPFCTTWSIYR